jgi:hypothetical protein
VFHSASLKRNTATPGPVRRTDTASTARATSSGTLMSKASFTARCPTWLCTRTWPCTKWARGENLLIVDGEHAHSSRAICLEVHQQAGGSSVLLDELNMCMPWRLRSGRSSTGRHREAPQRWRRLQRRVISVPATQQQGASSRSCSPAGSGWRQEQQGGGVREPVRT